MRRWIGAAKQRATDCLLGAAGCLLGAWLLDSLSDACAWILVWIGDAEIIGDRSGTSAALPHGAPWLLHAFGEFGPLLLTAAAFGTATWLACRTKLESSLAATCTAFWLAASLCTELLRYGWTSRGPLELLLQALGIPQAGAVVQQALAVTLGIGILLLLRRGLRRSRLLPLSAFALPACLLHYLVGDAAADSRILARLGAAYVPVALAIAAGVAASLPWGNWQRPSLRRGAGLAVAGALALALPMPAPRRTETSHGVVAQSEHWRITFDGAGFTPSARNDWIAGADERASRQRERLGLPVTHEPIQVIIVDSEDSMRRLGAGRRSAESFALDAGQGAVLMSTAEFVPEDPRAEPLLAMRQAWGLPVWDPMALALARYAVGQFGGVSLQAAASSIACQEAPYTAAAAIGRAGGWRSPLSRDAVGAAWVENVVARHGVALLESLYRQPIEESLRLCPDCVPTCATSELAAGSAARSPPVYFKGISFSHEGRGQHGYGSLAAQRELDRMRDLGANAVALVPYAFTAAPGETSIRFQTLETDARLMRTAAQARRLGLAVAIKPHLWAGGRFHGDISFQDGARFEEWFEDYRNWMLHYARLAELHGAELLVIGNELAGLTVREEAWRSLAAQVRKIYRGPITYAAHWQEELERVSFWDELDFIGVNFYFPIAAAGKSPERDSPEVLAAKQRIAQVRARFERPVLFTEVGFPALRTAAARPWEENSSGLDANLQARCYAIWLESFASAPHVTGMFWWKWPSHGRGSPFDPSHRPLAKPALNVLGEWFNRL